MQSIMQVQRLGDGRFAVRSIGGNTLNRILGTFDTETEAEEWMMRNTDLPRATSGILRPGGGQNVA